MDHLERMQIASVSRLLNNLLAPQAIRSKVRRGGTGSALAVARAVRANVVERENALPFLPSCNPGWRILIEIYISEGEQAPVSISDIGYVADMAGATTLRWLKLLESRQLVTRHPDPADKRRCWLHLSLQGRTAVERDMNDLAGRILPAVDLAHLA